MKKRFIGYRFVVLAIFMFGFIAIAAADNTQKPKIKRFRWSLTDQGYQINAILHNSFNHNIEEQIVSGIPTTFRFFLYFKQNRWYWDNKVVARAEYTHTVVYDTLRKVYKITKRRIGEDDSTEVFSTDNPSEMKTMMCAFKGNLDVNANRVKPDKQYYISLQASMDSEKLPEPWNYLLFFVSQDFKTKTSRQWLPIKRR